MADEDESLDASEGHDTVIEKKPTQSSDAKVDGNEKHPRKRQKHHFNAIRDQMEFYFGDANLSKDRFLRRLIDTDPFVPLDVFLNFNKLKKLTNSVEKIAKALSNSELLELDATQQKVRRRTAIPAERNVDEKTLYVESLPPNTDHDWVQRAFERFGAISYISLPKYVKSRKIKGFGFVEFAEECSVEKAIKAFKEFDGVLCMQQTDPAELSSVQAYIKEQKNEVDQIDADIVDTKKQKKRRRNSQEEVEGVEPQIKKTKTEVETATESDSIVETADETANEECTEGKDNSAAQPVKKRRKEKKAKCVVKRKKDMELNTEAFHCDLKILPKRDWKRLRNKYLNLQRIKVGELKRKAWKEQQQQYKDSNIGSTGGGAIGEKVETAGSLVSSAKKVKPNERKLHRMNMNFYGAGDSEEQALKSTATATDKDVKQNLALERMPLFSYQPGLIIEISFLEPCVSVKEFKADMRQYSAVKYVDVREGAMQAYLRLESASAAEDFVRQVNCAEYKCSVLVDDREKEYWQKINNDREIKFNKQVKVPQRRGREKVKKLLTKHIYFCDEDGD